MHSAEDAFLDMLARGQIINQDEYNQMVDYLPPEVIASALARRFELTRETRTLIEAARLYAHAGFLYEALELCSRSPHVHSLKQIVQKALPEVREAYPGARLVGKLLEEALLVINLDTGKMVRFPPILPATTSEELR